MCDLETDSCLVSEGGERPGLERLEWQSFQQPALAAVAPKGPRATS